MRKICLTLLLLPLTLAVVTLFSGAANAACRPCTVCQGVLSTCASGCSCISNNQKEITIKHIEDEFVAHREWLTSEFFDNHILPALMLFTEQITTMAMQQVAGIGMILDAKHQLETQRLFQELEARAHKDYQPSEGMCTFGTTVRSLAASGRNADISAVAISSRVLQRELLSGDNISASGAISDSLSRIAQFRRLYCNPKDNGDGLSLLCPNTATGGARYNKDISFSKTFDEPLTLKMDFTQNTLEPDEEDVFALAANLYAHDVSPLIAQSFLTDDDGNPKPAGVTAYMNIRAIAAKRSVARNSFATIAAMKSQGESEVQPYLYALMKEMGVSADNEEIGKYLGEKPSYYAQMEMLTKKLYQNPNFYAELYDKPANVVRKNAAMKAIELMQRRDMYRSSLRTEAILAVMLETALIETEEPLFNHIDTLQVEGQPISLPAN